MKSIVTFCLGLVVLFTAAEAHAADQLRVGIPADDDFHFSMLQVGVGIGTFEKEGLSLTILDFRGTAPMHQAMTAGSLDVALGAGTDFALIAKGAPEKAVGALSNEPTNFVVQVSTRSGITTVQGLKGARLGVSSTGALTYWLGTKLSVEQGWGKDGIVLVTLGGPEGTNAGLISGSIDGSVGSLEQGLRLQSQGRVKVLMNFGDIIHPFITHVIFASNDMMAHHADTLRRFLAAWYDTIIFARAHKAQILPYSQKVTGLSDDLAGKIYDLEMKGFSTTGHFDPAGVAAVKQTMLDLGVLKQSPDNQELLTEAYLPNGLKR